MIVQPYPLTAATEDGQHWIVIGWLETEAPTPYVVPIARGWRAGRASTPRLLQDPAVYYMPIQPLEVQIPEGDLTVRMDAH
jgi:hypothetical protein